MMRNVVLKINVQTLSIIINYFISVIENGQVRWMIYITFTPEHLRFKEQKRFNSLQAISEQEV